MKKLAAFLFICLIVTGIVKAESYSVEGNGTGSNNSIQIVNSSNTTNTQTSTSNINNTVSGNASTGNNSANGNTNGDTTIITGDATVHINIQNQTNQNYAEDDCNNCSTTPKVTITPNPTSSQNPTPTNKPTDGGGPNPHSDSDDPSDPNNPSPATNKDGEILGLAATSGNTTKQITTALGVLCLALSSLLLKRQLI